MIDRVAEKLVGPFPHSMSPEPTGRPAWLRPSATVNSHTSRPWLRFSDVGELSQPVEELILKYPAAALASAFLVGVAIAWWIKRK